MKVGLKAVALLAVIPLFGRGAIEGGSGSPADCAVSLVVLLVGHLAG